MWTYNWNFYGLWFYFLWVIHVLLNWKHVSSCCIFECQNLVCINLTIISSSKWKWIGKKHFAHKHYIASSQYKYLNFIWKIVGKSNNDFRRCTCTQSGFVFWFFVHSDFAPFGVMHDFAEAVEYEIRTGNTPWKQMFSLIACRQDTNFHFFYLQWYKIIGGKVTISTNLTKIYFPKMDKHL